MNGKYTQRQLLRFWDSRRPRPTVHPPLARLIRYAERGLRPSEAEETLRHLVDCPSCTESVLELGEAARIADTSPSILRNQAQCIRRDVELGRKSPFSLAVRRAARRPLTYVAAFGCLTAVLLAGWIWYQASQAPLPRVNVSIIELASVQQRSRSAPQPATHFEMDRVVILVFSPLNESGESFTRYYASLSTESTLAIPLFETWDLEPDANGDFRIHLPPGYLAPGRYTLRLSGVGEGQNPDLGEFEFEVVNRQ